MDFVKALPFYKSQQKNIYFFTQVWLIFFLNFVFFFFFKASYPAINIHGKIALHKKNEIYLASNGYGGIF